MSAVLGIWYELNTRYSTSFSYRICRHLVLEGGKVKTIHTPASVQITNVSYGEEIVDAASRDVVKLSFESLATSDDEDDEDEEKEDEDIPISTTVLCVLTPGKACKVLYPAEFALTFCCYID